MATRKTIPPPQDLSQLFHFNPHIIFDPVPWPLFSQFDRATQVKVAQAQLDLHTQTLQARLKAANQISAALKGKK